MVGEIDDKTRQHIQKMLRAFDAARTCAPEKPISRPARIAPPTFEGNRRERRRLLAVFERKAAREARDD